MKCKHCGNHLSLEDEVCPYCGNVNEHARQHIKDMKHYKGEFEHTKKNVYTVTKRYTSVTVRVAAIAILLIGIMVLLIVSGRSYEIRRRIEQYKADRNSEAYMEILDKYIEEENYQALSAFWDEHYINSFTGVYERYVPVFRVAQNYNNIYRDVMDIVCPSEYQERERVIKNLTDNLNYFYDSLDMERYQYYEEADSEENKDILARMRKKVMLLMETYCNLSKDEAEKLEEMSEARRAVLVEEAIIGEE